MKKYKSIIFSGVFVVLLAISLYIRLAQTANYQFPFTYDQARDLIHIRIPGTFKDLPLVGPTTSINGLMLGPGYYYFNLPAFWIWNGDPQGLTTWNILWFGLAAVVIYGYFYKRNIVLGFLVASIYLFAPQMFTATRYFWNAHAMVYFAVFYFLALLNYWERRDYKSAVVLGITCGIAMHFEAAFAIVLLAFALITVVSSRKWMIIKWYLIGLVPWFVPQVVFELSKNMAMTKLLISEMVGGGGILGDKMSFGQAAISHIVNIAQYTEGQFILPYRAGLIMMLLALIGGLIEKSHRKTIVNLIGLLGFTYLFYAMVYHHELKRWYLDSVRVWYIFVFAIGVRGWLKLFENNKKIKVTAIVLLGVFIARSFYLTVLDQKRFINNADFAKDDPKLAQHVLKSIDWVYEKSPNQGFKAYTYVPEIYDYPYQYTYWWYGRKKYGFMPAEVSYLPNVPDYVPRQSQFVEDVRAIEEERVALIYERKGEYLNWLAKFSEYCVKEKTDFEWNVSAEIRTKCK